VSLLLEADEIDRETEIDPDELKNVLPRMIHSRPNSRLYSSIDPRNIPPERPCGPKTKLVNSKGIPPLNTFVCPQDAVWIVSTNSLKCETPQEIYLLVKSSDFIFHDLYHAYDNSPRSLIEYELVLKEWYYLIPSMEFGCFVRNPRFLCIST
jgi:D123